MDLVGHRHFGRRRDVRPLGCVTELGRLEELARPGRILEFCKEDEIVGFVGVRRTLGRAQWRAQSLAHRLLHERADPCLSVGSQPL